VSEPWLVVPTKDREEWWANLAEAAPGRAVFVQTGRGKHPTAHNVFEGAPINISRWWNAGLDYAQEHGARYVAVANDDIELMPGDLEKMRDHLVETECTICWSDPFKMTGWLWMLDLTHDVRPDKTFRWWYGDNDLSIRSETEGHGSTGVAVGAIHHHPNKLTEESKGLQAIAERDQITFRKRYAELLRA
jgi:hypothetical protein